MKSKEIRASFLDFFKQKGHEIVESAPVVPIGDTTLLFTNAGMNQFKDMFLGSGSRPYKRCADTQKCMRVSGKHNDLDAVGRDSYHHTFFEMLGNWSFGDYYKKDAILWAWELLTDVWKIPKDKLYATVYKTDEEALELWKEVTDIGHERILKFGKKDNFWEMGDTGPCGPCSEIHIDLGPESCDKKDVDHVCSVNGICGRYIELWNLVFMQYNRDEQGKLHDLPAKHVDTGAGFERLAAVLDNRPSNYDTDLFTPIIEQVSQLSNKIYPGNSEAGMPYRVIADHIRALCFTIADGALPGNEGRGYVLRRILRRASRFGLNLGIEGAFLYKLVDTVISVMGSAFPELESKKEHIVLILKNEEDRFSKTLDKGLSLLEDICSDMKNNDTIDGALAFKLYDTFGFPYELTEEIADEKGLRIDKKGFDAEMATQKEQARANQKKGEYIADASIDGIDELTEKSEFKGYSDIETRACVIGIWKNSQKIKKADKGEKVQILLSETPFYAESGGQVGDTGRISNENGLTARVIQTDKIKGLSVSTVEVLSGFLEVNQKIIAETDNIQRSATEKNHTATHLLHAALKKVLGKHVNQAGSLVTPDRLRFDFTHFDKMTPDQILRVEKIVNDQIMRNEKLSVAEMDYNQAVTGGATALFDEKYGDKVRVVEIEGFSKELCGGTHVSSTGEIGSFKVISEASVSQGIRRIEAATGMNAFNHHNYCYHLLEGLGRSLNTNPDNLSEMVEKLKSQLKQKDKEIEKIKQKDMVSGIDDVFGNAIDIKNFKIVPAQVKGLDMPSLRDLADRLMEKAGTGVILAGSAADEKAFIVVKVSKSLTKSIKAGDLVKAMAGICGGGGGGRPDMAQAGGKDPSRISEAVDKGIAMVKEAFGSN